jgi:Putative peptidoglycan binding domain
VPRKITEKDDTPRRRRGAAAIAVETPAERGLAMRILLHSPKDMVAGAVAFAAVSAIITNALFLQAGHHPSPMFGNVVVMPAAELSVASPLPRPRPVEVITRPAELLPLEQKNSEQKVPEPKAAEPKAGDPLANLLKATGAPQAAASNVPRPPAPIPAAGPTVGSRRVAAVQRALTEYGYGQLKPTGTVGSDTQAAIQKFERERKIPVTGQMSDRLVHELAAAIGHPID